MPDILKAPLRRLVIGMTLDDGQALTEYALVLALIALVAVVALTVLGHGVTNALTTAAPSS